MNKERCIILIDGSNFYFKLKDLKLHNLLSFDFSGFTKLIANRRKIVQAAYFIAKAENHGFTRG